MSGTTTGGKRNVISVTGGKVHNPHPGFHEGDTSAWPHCRSYGGNAVRSRYTFTDLEVTCSRCCEQNRRHEAAVAARLEREAAEAAELEAAQTLAAAPAPAMSEQSENVTSVNGGQVHLPHPGFGGDVFPWPHCRSYGGDAARSTFRHTALEVSCKPCAEEVRRRQIAAARQAEAAEVKARGGAPVRAEATVPAGRCGLATAAAAARYEGIVAAGEMWIKTVAGSQTARLTLAFPNVAGHGRDRRAAAETVARQFGVRTERPRIMVDDYAGRYPYGAQPWEYGARDITVTGTPSAVARFMLALPGILVDLETLATRAAKAYGRFLRTAPGVELEMMPSEHRSALRRWRREAFDECAYIAGYTPSLARLYRETDTMSTQARAYAHTLETLPDLYGYADEAEVSAMVAAARHEAMPAIVECPDLDRAARLFAALDEVYAPAEFGALPLDPEYVAPTVGELVDDVEALAVEVDPAPVEVDAAAAVLAEAAAVVEAAADQLAPALPAARKDAPLDRRPARRPHAPRPARLAPVARPLGGGRGSAGGRPGERAALGEVRVLRGRAGRAGGAGAAHGPRRGGLAPRAGGDARALGGRRGGVLGAHPRTVRPAAVRVGRQARRGMVLAL